MERVQGSGQLAAAELGVWMFLANAATVIGFQETPATRGAFLIRLTAVFTPIVALVAGQQSAPAVWAGSVLAFVGGLLISLPRQGGSLNLATLSPGDLIMVAAAVMWSCQTVRLGKAVARFEVGKLAYRQMSVNALLCCGWAVAEQLQRPAGLDVPLLGQAWHDIWRWAALLWPAIGPWGLGTILQSAGQRSVSPSRTQIILALDPVFATIIAGILLGSSEQQLGQWGWVGAACILTASFTSRE